MSKEKRNDVTLKIFSLVFAIVMWSYVMSEVNPKTTREFRNVDVVFSNVEELERSNIAIMEPKEIKVNIKLKGRRSDILKITEDDIIAKVDVRGYSEGTKKVPIYIDVPSKVEIEDYSPKEVVFKFESIITKEKPVELKIEGNLKEGYVLGDGEIKPQSVILKGPRSWINSVSDVVAMVNIDGRSNDLKMTVPIRLLDDNGNDIRGLEKEPNVVDVFVPVFKAKTVPVEIDLSSPLPSDYESSSLKVYPNKVNIVGLEKDLSDIRSIKTEKVDVNTLITQGKIKAQLIIPEGVELVDGNGEVNVSLLLEKNDTKTFEYSFDEINVENLAEGLIVDSNGFAGNIRVKVKGAENRINSISKSDLTPRIDLSNLDEGTYEVNIIVPDIQGISVLEVNPSNIRININKQQ
jgi:YbbR domain-containing protein